MYLKKAFWSDALTGAGAETSAGDDSSSSLITSPAIEELVKSLDNDRLYREVTLALKTGLKDARAEFSFLRLRALRTLLNFLRSVASSDSTITLFSHSQSIPELQGNLIVLFSLFYVHCIVLSRFRVYVLIIVRAQILK